MRALVATIVLLLCSMPALAEGPESGSDLFAQALQVVTGHVHGLGGDDLPDRDDMSQYAFAEATVGGSENAFRYAATEFYDPVTADEMVAAYETANRTSIRIAAPDVNGARVLPLEEFATGPYTYDWKRLNEKYPRIKAIFRVSQPATAGYRTLIHVDVITPTGTPWVNVLELERQTDGSSWKQTRAMLGSNTRDRRVLSRAGL